MEGIYSDFDWIEQLFEVNNIPDESKVDFISTHLYEIDLKLHKHFLGIIRGKVAWVIYKEAILLRFGNIQNKQFFSDNVKDSSCGLHVIDNVRDLSVNDSHYEVNLEKNECAHKMFDEMSIKKILKQDIIVEYSDASMKELIEVENGLVEDVVVETVKESLEVENEVNDDEKVSDDIKVKTSKRVDSEILVIEVDGFMSDEDTSELLPYKNNRSLVHRQNGFYLLEKYSDKRTTNICKLEMIKPGIEIKRKLGDVDAMNNEGNLGHVKFDIWEWRKRKKPRYTNCKFKSSRSTKDDILKSSPHLVTDLEDKIILRGMDCYGPYWE
ncbi:hypothetical protein Tco_1409891 [Tanacetum coccineum]